MFHFVIVPDLFISQITELDANANRSGMKTMIGNILFFPPVELKQTNPRFALIREKHELFRLRINSWPLEIEPRYLRFGDTGERNYFYSAVSTYFCNEYLTYNYILYIIYIYIYIYIYILYLYFNEI